MVNKLKKLSVLLFIGLLFVTLVGCGEPADVDTGTDSETTTSEKQSDARKVSVNETFTANGLTATIGEVQIESDKISVGMTIKNDTNDVLSFYPDQEGTVVGSMQLDADLFTQCDVSGEIHSGVEKSGVVTFITTGDKTIVPEEVTSMTLHLGDVTNQTTWDAQPFDIELSIS